jgi:hypothetical protein
MSVEKSKLEKFVYTNKRNKKQVCGKMCEFDLHKLKHLVTDVVGERLDDDNMVKNMSILLRQP